MPSPHGLHAEMVCTFYFYCYIFVGEKYSILQIPHSTSPFFTQSKCFHANNWEGYQGKENTVEWSFPKVLISYFKIPLVPATNSQIYGQSALVHTWKTDLFSTGPSKHWLQEDFVLVFQICTQNRSGQWQKSPSLKSMHSSSNRDKFSSRNNQELHSCKVSAKAEPLSCRKPCLLPRGPP